MGFPKFRLFLCLLALTINNSALASENLTLSDVALFITREHLSNLTSTVVVAERSITPESGSNNTLLLEYILQHLNGRIAVQLYMRTYSEQPLEYYIFIVDSLEAFTEIYHEFKDNDFERRFRFLIVLTQFTQDLHIIMEKIFKLCHAFDVIDVNIVVNTPIFGVGMFTYYLYSETVCRRCVPILLYNFNQGLENFEEAFPEKLTNFHGCPFRVSARVFPPYVSFIGNRSDPKPIGDWKNLMGIEGFLLKYLAQALNFTIDLQPFSVERNLLKANRTFGCFTQLLEHKADIVIGGFVNSHFGRYMFSPTITYHSSHFKYVIRGKKYTDSLGRLAKPFSLEVWYVLAAFLCLKILFMTALRMASLKVQHFVFGEENHNPVTNFWAIFLGYSVGRTPRRNFARYILFHLLFLSLVLRNAYQGSLYDAFRTNRFTSIPLGYDDLIKWNYTMLLTPVTAESFSFPQDRVITMNYEEYQPRLRTLDSLDGKYVTVLIQDCYIDYFKKNISNRTKLIMLPEVIYNYQFVLYLSKHSIFLPAINSKINELAAAGILKKISQHLRVKDKLFKTYFMKKTTRRPLQNKRLEALYVICGVMIAISVVVFCFEIISVNHCKWLQWIFI